MPIPPQFRSQTELVQFLETLEQRIEALEMENQSYKDTLNTSSGAPVPIQVQQWLQKFLPQTSLLSHSFIARAFTVWGHYFAAQLIILAGVLVVYLLVMVIILATSR